MTDHSQLQRTRKGQVSYREKVGKLGKGLITKHHTEEAASPKYGVFPLAGLLSLRLAGICGPEKRFLLAEL